MITLPIYVSSHSIPPPCFYYYYYYGYCFEITARSYQVLRKQFFVHVWYLRIESAEYVCLLCKCRFLVCNMFNKTDL